MADESNGFKAPPAGACVLVTGGAGFIGSHLSAALLEKGYRVVAVDSLIPYYDVRIKRKRLAELQTSDRSESYHFEEADLSDATSVASLIKNQKPEAIVHLAAQAGVRYCEQNPEEATRNNIQATRILIDEAAKEGSSVKHLLFASSSSIYGCHPRPWGEELEPQPAGVYGNSKKTGEEMLQALVASKKAPHLALAALRFFTVYGPHGRPDMAPAKFLEKVHRGEAVPVYGDGSAIRDFTYVGDIVQGIVKALQHPRTYEVYNLGKGSVEPASVLDLIRAIEQQLKKKARIEFSGPRAGDVPATQADITKAQKMLGYDPHFTLQEGMKETVRYYLRNVQAIPLFFVFLQSGEEASEVETLLKSLAAQSSPPRVLVVDQSASEQERETRALLVEKVYPAAQHLIVASDANAWDSALAWVTSALLTPREGETHADADHESSLFIATAVAGDSFEETHVSACMEAVAAAGSELVATHLTSSSPSAVAANAAVDLLAAKEWQEAGLGCSNVFIRLDQLRRVISLPEVASVSSSSPGTLYASAVPLLHAAGNVRTQALSQASCSRRR